MFAIIVWKNSLVSSNTFNIIIRSLVTQVFHSLDKLTSFFLHAFPPLTVHLFRWGLIPNPAIRHDDHLAPVEVLLLPLGLYLCWQLGYWTITEGVLRSQLANDQDLITSIRYLASDKKNGFRNLCLSLLCWLGLNHPGEELVADSVKTKITFAVTQLVYTLITIIPTPFLFSSYRLSCVYMVLLYGFGTWNGASYYIEVSCSISISKIVISCIRCLLRDIAYSLPGLARRGGRMAAVLLIQILRRRVMSMRMLWKKWRLISPVSYTRRLWLLL